jgi:hypothetical protein
MELIYLDECLLIHFDWRTPRKGLARNLLG